VVTITRGRLTPSRVVVDPGTVVRWVNRDRTSHELTTGLVCIRASDGCWTTEPIGSGRVADRVFGEPGTWAYRSARDAAARGEVVVRVPPPAEGVCAGWSARYAPAARGAVTLIVTGRCEMPSPGYSVTLRPASPQGTNPRALILERVTRAPTGPAPQVVTTVSVSYRLTLATRRYQAVTITPDGANLVVR
jgi:hypothetical protein